MLRSIFFFVVASYLSINSHAEPNIEWAFDTGAPIYGSCLAGHANVYCANTNGEVYALNATTGKKIWRYSTGAAIYSSVSADEEFLYVQSDDGYVYTLKLSDGNVQWKSLVNQVTQDARIPGFEPGGWDDRASTPLPSGDVVYVGSADNKLYALDEESGEALWTFQAKDKIRSTPAVEGEHVIFGTFSGVVHCINSVTGKEVWSLDLETTVAEPSRRIAINSNPTIVDGTIYIGSRNTHLYALDLYTGEPKWVFPYPNSWVESTAVVDSNVLYIGSSFLKAQLAINAETGELIWRNNSVEGLSFSTPTITQDAYYTGISGGFNVRQQPDFAPFGGVLRLAKDTGHELWRFEINDFYEGLNERGVIGEILVHEERLIFGAMDGKVYSLNEASDI